LGTYVATPPVEKRMASWTFGSYYGDDGRMRRRLCAGR